MKKLGLLAAASTCCNWVLIAAPPEGTDWEPLETMTDEFDGAKLDETKWHLTNPTWKGRPPLFFHQDALVLKNGMLHVMALNSEESGKRTLPEGFTHISGFLKSKEVVRFGYFEVRAKLMNAPLVSGFWLSHHERDEWSEIDIVEAPAGIERFRYVIPTNTHYFYGPHYKGTIQKHLVTPEKVEINFESTADFHVYGMEWTPTKIAWYIDGKKVRGIENTWYYQPLKMNINVESNPYFDAVPNDETLPNAYIVDWVRSWQPKGVFEPVTGKN